MVEQGVGRLWQTRGDRRCPMDSKVLWFPSEGVGYDLHNHRLRTKRPSLKPLSGIQIHAGDRKEFKILTR